ncbi:MAG: hypothetical protein SXA11_20120 [Cyanobacteriota bacterium]|nr:hypothetical protein [Cyanobacteriota bacterium]
MQSKNLLELAKEGDPKIISQIINRSLAKKGIKVYVVRSNNSLEVTLESGQVANQKEVLVQFIRNGMEKLGVESIHTVTVCGVPTGTTSPVWQEDIILGNPEETIPATGSAMGQPIAEEDPLYATDEAETALEVPEDYQTEPPDDFSEDEEELFYDGDDGGSQADFDDGSGSDFDDDSQVDFDSRSNFDDDSPVDFDEGEYDDDDDDAATSKPAKKKLPILAIILPLILLPLVVLAILHFAGIFRLPFLGGSEADTATPDAVESPEPSPSPEETAPAQGSASPSPSPEQPPGEETWTNARTTAYGAAVKAGTAQTRAEWNEVANEWQRAIDLMKEVPQDNPNYQTAQQKVQEYQNNLNVAKQRAATAPN